MVEVRIDYQGDLRCEARHAPSGQSIRTDAPVDNHGKGEAFSPTDLLAAALGSCMETVMGITARQREIPLQGMRILVRKVMSEDLPRRIERLEVEIFMPIAEDHPHKKILQSAALGCPVYHSLSPEIETPILWHWGMSVEAAPQTGEGEESAGEEVREEGEELAGELAPAEEMAEMAPPLEEPVRAEEKAEESPLAWLERVSKQV
ncbi:MAG: OsmC family protein [Verrucomicrobiales bacterium]